MTSDLQGMVVVTINFRSVYVSLIMLDSVRDAALLCYIILLLLSNSMIVMYSYYNDAVLELCTHLLAPNTDGPMPGTLN